MKVLHLGKSGLLGASFLRSLSGSADFEVYAFDKKSLDISDYSSLKKIFKQISPDITINCSAYTAVDECERHKSLAFQINGDAPGEIANVCKEENSILIHFSTDYVFDGEKYEGYKEDDLPSPINTYGESKLLGEQLISKNMSDYYIIRTSWLFGENGKNFVNTIIDLSEKNEELDIVADQIGCPTYAKDLSDYIINYLIYPFVEKLPVQHERQFDTDVYHSSKKLPFGIYHIVNSGKTSWYDYAYKIFEILNIKTKINKISSEKLARAAKRPKFSVLLDTKLQKKLRPWEEALEAYLNLYFISKKQ